MQSQRKAAAPRQARPAQRYFRGKAPKGAASSHSDSDEDEEQEQQYEEGDVPIGGDVDEDEAEDEGGAHTTSLPEKISSKAMNVALRNVNIENGKVIVDGRQESGRTAMEESDSEGEEALIRPPGLDEDVASSSEYETDSDEEDSKPATLFRPVFVPKRGRATIQEKESESQNTEEAQMKREQEAEKRKKESHDLVAESIKRELAEKEVQDVVPDIDDTDGLDPAAEFEEWRLRELGRIKRDKEAQVRREEEREEVERRRALPEAQRLAEDLEHAQKLRDEKPKGQQKFLQKYYHKGAFHQDADILKKHDYTEATESTVDVSLLPSVMQVKNFGKRSRTKYTHLLDQDTTRVTGGFGGLDPKAKASGPGLKDGQGCFNCGGPHLRKDCPNVDLNRSIPSSSGHGTGANDGFTAVKRQWGVRKEERPTDDRRPEHWKVGASDGANHQRLDEGGHRDDEYRDQDRRPRRPRSRSPDGRDQNRDRYERRRRSRSRSYERSDKRRRRD